MFGGYIKVKNFVPRLPHYKVMMFNAPLNNISVISWGSVLLVERTGVSAPSH